MRIRLLFLLLLTVGTSDATFLSRRSESLIRTANNAGRHVIKRSAGLAHNLRLAYNGLRIQQQPGSAKMYCVNLPSNATGLTGGGGGGAAVSSSTVSQSGGGSTVTAPAPSPSGSANVSSPWKVAQSYQGSTFFDGWDFTNAADVTTDGIAQYIDQNTAQSANIIEINSAGNAVMRVETTPQVTGNRQSIRITTQYSYTGGLIILDAVHMPTGCGTWPAFWSNGPNWPVGGEIDMVEGVNDYTNNQATLHTDVGCTMPSSDPAALNITGTLIGTTDCSAADTGNAGCGIRASQTNSFGAAFNDINGGVYATLWDNAGISVFFFPRSAIPADITADAPQPSTWGQPMANFPASTCSPFKFFYNHTAIFDTTLCGVWAGAVWSAAGVPGQDQSCAQRTGVATCEDFVRSNGTAFSEAYWEVASVKIYQMSSD
ncbi:putative glycosidase C21B10.07 [Grifola frondosa]|uniref:Putative glycosidase C21B10.07 n=1 Tax=Grifola frondosa TaxID=5627 RepID=A0A1C7MSF5_GRIFR|nr:putative glycosidase C21B10.07 [Grifola frondosa]